MAQRVSPPWKRRPTATLRRSQLGYLGIGVRRVLGGGNAGGGAGVATARFDFSTGSVVDISGNGITPSFTRATTKTQTDWEGRPSTALSGEVVFEGLRREHNLILSASEDFNHANWTKSNLTVTVNATTDPLGGSTADKLVEAANNTFHYDSNPPTTVLGNVYVLSVYAKAGERSILQLGGGSTQFGVNVWANFDLANGVMGSIGSATAAGIKSMGSGWYRCVVIGTTIGASAGETFYVSPQTSAAAARAATYAGDGTSGLYVWGADFKDVSRQSNQTASEYVSVGVLSTPFHGARVDGVAYKNTLNGNSIVANVLTESTGASIPKRTGVGIARLPGGGNGSYFSTPGTNVAGDLFAWVDITNEDWTPAAETPLIGKWTDAGNLRSWVVTILATGVIRSYYSRDGTELLVTTSSVAPSFADGTVGRVGVFRNSATGDVTFYTAPTGSTNWTPLGTVQSSSAGALFATSAAVTIGQHNAGVGSAPNKASILRAGYGNSITGTSLGDFTPSAWTTGVTFVGGAGETWTLNGGARVFKWANGYYPEVAGTNVVLQSENFGTTWVAVSTPTRSAAAKRCGNIVLDLIGDDEAGVLDGYAQTITFTGDAVKAVSFFFSQGTSTSTVFRILDGTAVADRLLGAITWTNGIPTITMTTGTLIRIKEHTNGVWRAEVLTTSVTAANSNGIYFYPATVAALTVTGTGDIYVGGVQAENNIERVSSYVATTTAAVTRNKDDMAVTTLGAWFNATAGTMVASFVAGTNSTANNRLADLSDGTTDEQIAIYRNGVQGALIVRDGAATQANIAGGSLPVSVAGAIAASYALNDFVLVVNGVVIGTDAAGTLPTVTRLDIGQNGSQAEQFNGLIPSLDYYPSRLPNSTLQVLAAA